MINVFLFRTLLKFVIAPFNLLIERIRLKKKQNSKPRVSAIKVSLDIQMPMSYVELHIFIVILELLYFSDTCNIVM